MPLDLPDGQAVRTHPQRPLPHGIEAELSIRLRAGVKKWLPRFGGGDVPDVLIRDQRQRWGSCAPDGTLRFNWRVMMLEPALVDYVIVHELAHLGVRNHSDNYWKLVNRVMPDAQERRQKLREVGRTLPL